MAHRNDRDFDQRPNHNFDGPYARDAHRGGLGDDYARDTGWSGAGRHDNYTREQPSYRGRGPKNWQRSDERIREMINERLTDHDDVDATDIEVTVENAEVTLNGIVTNRREKRLAEDAAWSCGSVQDVHNRLTIGERATHIGKASE